MISVSVPKEISDYKEKVIFGLSLRQLVCGVIAVGLAVATGLLLVQVLGLSIDRQRHDIRHTWQRKIHGRKR